MIYWQTLETLFELLAKANLADSELSCSWQQPNDAKMGANYYGSIRSAIVAIAGEEIVQHWAESGEINYLLANRNLQVDQSLKNVLP